MIPIESIELQERRRWKWVGLLSILTVVFAVIAISCAGCTTVPAPVVVSPEAPPAQAALDNSSAEQIAALKSESAAKSRQLDTVAASACAIQLVGLPHTPESDGKPVIEREAALIATAAGEPSPEARAVALERANAQLRKDLARADALYGQATAEAQRLGQQLEAYAREISARDTQLDQLRRDAATERTAAAKKLQETIDTAAKEFADYKSAEAARTRRLWVNTLRFGGLAIVFIGIGLIALSKGAMLAQGGILAAGGAAVIAVGMTFDLVSRQPWFPYVAAGLGVSIIGSGVWACIHYYRQRGLGTQLAAALNDLKTEAEAGASATTTAGWAALREHLDYRLGKSGSAQLTKFWQQLGLDAPPESIPDARDTRIFP